MDTHKSKVCIVMDDKCSRSSLSKRVRESQVGLQPQMEKVSLKRQHLNEHLKEVRGRCLEEDCFGRGNSKCKGPGAGVCLACGRNS